MGIKPTINKIDTFDANNEYTIEFAYQGNQPYINNLIISDEDDNVVYDKLVETMKMSHTIPPGTLSNNNSYYAQVYLYDVNGNMSELSDKSYFYCYTTPTITVSNLNVDGSTKVSTSNYDVQVLYSQIENRKLKEYVYSVYDSIKNQVYTSGTKYSTSDMGNVITCPIKALENDSIYYFYFEGITVDNVKVETGKIPFYVSYMKSLSYSVLNVECDKNAGCMKYNTYLVIVEGKSTQNYELNDGILKVIDGKVYYDSGFKINDDFIIGIKYRNGTTITFQNEVDSIKLTQNEYEGKDYYKLEISNSILPPMLIYSRLFEKSADMRTIYIKKTNEMYGLTIVEG